MQWFRFYSEFASDPKVQRMPEVMQRRLVMLLCARCDGDVTFCDDDIAFHWRISDGELSATKAMFVDKGFIDEQWNVLNWNKRQFISDSSSDRTKRYRERHRTSQERHSDSDVTNSDALDTEQNRTDTEQKPLTQSVERFPLNSGKEYWVSQEECIELQRLYPAVNVPQELREMRAWLLTNPTRRKTRNGIRKFMNSWLSKEQDKPGGLNGRKQQTSAERNQQSTIDAIRTVVAGYEGMDSSGAGIAGDQMGQTIDAGEIEGLRRRPTVLSTIPAAHSIPAAKN